MSKFIIKSSKTVSAKLVILNKQSINIHKTCALLKCMSRHQFAHCNSFLFFIILSLVMKNADLPQTFLQNKNPNWHGLQRVRYTFMYKLMALTNNQSSKFMILQICMPSILTMFPLNTKCLEIDTEVFLFCYAKCMTFNI